MTETNWPDIAQVETCTAPNTRHRLYLRSLRAQFRNLSLAGEKMLAPLFSTGLLGVSVALGASIARKMFTRMDRAMRVYRFHRKL